MCGIVGIASYLTKVDRIRAEAMCKQIEHRGPDDHGTYIDHSSSLSVALGSQRLSILDLSPAGHMPMLNSKGDVAIVYNGEIYNHPKLREDLERRGHDYKSKTDTETVLHAYEEFGTECFSILNGMFALAIYDQARCRLVIARDRMGIKPLYYSWNGSELVFSSELKAMLTQSNVQRSINRDALDLYMALGYVPSPYSLISGVKKLEPGHFLVLQDRNLESNAFWEPRSSSLHANDCSLEELASRTSSIISASVERQLMSDVPVGVLLSGGLDSTIIAYLAKQHSSKPIHTFSTGFSTRSSALELRYNEDREMAKSVALELGTIHHEINISDRDLIPVFEQLLGSLDEPVWEPSYLSIYLMSRLAYQNGVKVLMTGDGSDELFGGYEWYINARQQQSFDALPFLDAVLTVSSRVTPESDLRRKLVDVKSKYRQPGFRKYLLNHQHFDSETRKSLHSIEVEQQITEKYLQQLLQPVQDQPAEDQFAFADMLLWVREHFNQRLDRMTMLASVEGRVPFQDNDVVDFALSVSTSKKIVSGIRKALLVESYKHRIPSWVVNRRKRPFAAPAKAWLQGSLQEYALEQLSASSVKDLGFLNDKAVESIAHGYIRSGFSTAANHTKFIQVWNLLALCVWAKRWKVSG